MPEESRCPACGAGDLRVFHEQTGIPVNSCLLLPDRDAAEAFPRGDLRLAFCRACGFITNEAFDPALSTYSAQYEETQGFSPRFRAFARDLAERWIKTYDIRDKHVVEIGCGKGEFLELLCELGPNRGTGIDPSYRADRLHSETARGIEFITEKYTEAHGDLVGDVIVCRHTLEHIHPVADFLGLVRRSIGDRRRTLVLFELPDVTRVLEDMAFWDLYYEHCSYFSPGSLARLFRRCGFDLLDLWLDFDDQYILLEARPGDGQRPALLLEDDLDRLERAVDDFERTYQTCRADWGAMLTRAARKGRVVLWGAGSKGVSFLTSLGVTEEVDAAVDVNPFKQGMFMAGTGHPIIAPSELKEDPPATVFVMNGIYRDEIRAELLAMDIEAEVVPL